jgi:predicted small lipoprotein YifL
MGGRALLAALCAIAALGVFAACGDGEGPAEESPAQQIPDDAVQSDEAAPLDPSGEDTLSAPD